MTRSSIAVSRGRSSQFGEGINAAPDASPSELICTPATMASVLGVKLVFDTEALHTITQCAKRDAEHLGSSCPVVVRLLERVENRLALYCIEPLLQREPGEL